MFLAHPMRAVVAIGWLCEGGVGGGEVTALPQSHLIDQHQASALRLAWRGVQGTCTEHRQCRLQTHKTLAEHREAEGRDWRS